MNLLVRSRFDTLLFHGIRGMIPKSFQSLKMIKHYGKPDEPIDHHISEQAGYVELHRKEFLSICFLQSNQQFFYNK